MSRWIDYSTFKTEIENGQSICAYMGVQKESKNKICACYLYSNDGQWDERRCCNHKRNKGLAIYTWIMADPPRNVPIPEPKFRGRTTRYAQEDFQFILQLVSQLSINSAPDEISISNNNNTPAEVESKDGNCIICLSRETKYVMNPCGHKIFCKECVKAGTHNKVNGVCPVCRKEIISIIEVFDV